MSIRLPARRDSIDRCTDGFITSAIACLALLGTLVCLPSAAADASTTLRQEDRQIDWSPDSIESMPIDELAIRVAPLSVAELEALADALQAELATTGRELADAMIEQLRAEGDEAAASTIAARVDELSERRSSLVARAGVVLSALEALGGDVAARRAAVAAVDSLRAPTEPAPSDDADSTARDQAAELIAVVRAEAQVHERERPWTVPLSELKLGLQPLTGEQIIERLGAWRTILQGELRKRVRTDILLNDAEKLEAAMATAGVEATDEQAIKDVLAARSEGQQRIINAVVERMNVAIAMAEKRGADASEFTNYIASATGRNLNWTDPAVLWAQVSAWLRSPDGGVAIGLNLLKFAAILVAAWILSRIVGRIVLSAVRRTPGASSLLGPVLSGVARKVIFLVGAVVAVSMLGVNVGPLLALIGAAGLVIGLALQGTLSNFASGILILINKPYDVGDVISAGGVTGKVERMNLVSTSVLTFDNQLMLVPNNTIWNDVITNVTGKDTRRVDMTFGIAYDADMDQAVELITEAISKHEKVLAEPAPIIRVNELADNSVNIIARPWARTADYWDVYWDTTREVKARMDAAGIGIPFPQRDLHLVGPIEVKMPGGPDAGSQRLDGDRPALAASGHRSSNVSAADDGDDDA